MRINQPLALGQYQVKWKIVGTDGHPIKDTYTFTVVASKVGAEPQEKTPSVRTETKKEEPSTATTRATADSWLPFLIAGGLLVLSLYFFYRIVLKGRKR